MWATSSLSLASTRVVLVTCALAAASTARVAVASLRVSVGDATMCGCGPNPILVRVRASDLVVAEAQRVDDAIVDERGFVAFLLAAKQLRPDRTQVILRVDDGVPFSRAVRVVDLAQGIDYLSTWIVARSTERDPWRIHGSCGYD